MAATTVQSDAVVAGICPDHCIPAGIVLSRTGTYTATAALDANSVIELIPMPKGAQLLDLMIAHSALGAGRTIDVGTGDNVDSFIDGSSVVAAGQKRWGCAVGGAVANVAENIVHGDKLLAATWPYEFTANDSIDAKIIGDTFPNAGVITGVAIYKMEGGIADET
jgi:hypothetical protein